MNERPATKRGRATFVRDLLRAMISSIGGGGGRGRAAAVPKNLTPKQRPARKRRNRTARRARTITRARSRRDGRKRATR
jgi:hypothetical protein